jgi:4a-hydroxytetrahydrobiopterin dehydratase
MTKLTPTELPQALTQLPHWALDAAGTGLVRQLVFADFAAAFGYMAQVALWAEAANHHPEWHNVYNRLHITWSTHDVGGVSDNDVRMAQRCDQAFALLQGTEQAATSPPDGAAHA